VRHGAPLASEVWEVRRILVELPRLPHVFRVGTLCLLLHAAAGSANLLLHAAAGSANLLLRVALRRAAALPRENDGVGGRSGGGIGIGSSPAGSERRSGSGGSGGSRPTKSERLVSRCRSGAAEARGGGGGRGSCLRDVRNLRLQSGRCRQGPAHGHRGRVPLAERSVQHGLVVADVPGCGVEILPVGLSSLVMGVELLLQQDQAVLACSEVDEDVCGVIVVSAGQGKIVLCSSPQAPKAVNKYNEQR